MKLALGPVRLLAASLTLGALAALAGCASAPGAAPVSTTSVSSAALVPGAVAPSTLAPAAWEGEEPARAAALAAPPTPTWGAPAATTQSLPIAPTP